MTQKLSFSIKEASAVIGCGLTKVYEVLNDGSLPGRKLGRRTIILKEDLELFLSNLQPFTNRE